ncbi:TPA: hypothetical protein SMR62_001943 [Proteus mirabilis]|uniref:Uncharacterized protein n=1 Tax=Proteus mirabilis TaxID=584 RepID=A0AAN3YW04_PROMI|nr:hypothetical protein [Proteus mirabilis]EKW9777747.1 hypothetical protein [Proteus mirabilis]EMD1500808.1 hypothetical protein [Proteus mirabilis]MDE8640686.1 hypothetical protein [Proteus mirabilis]MDE8642291.1 hypothetical protein [Proteus mirabilis]QKV33513.1 hypothetical protein GJR66_14980 [Proteus mirabilis]
MTEDRYYDYLVIGGEHDGMVLNGPHLRELEITCGDQPMLNLRSRGSEAETITTRTVSYRVIEHITDSGLHYFIASNEDLNGRNDDINSKINESAIAPIN